MSSTGPGGEKNFGLERLIFFSDAVFAIAITLLVLDIRLPASVKATDFANHFNEIIPQIASYALSFFVIGAYWVAHHRFYEHVVRYDVRILWLNLLLLLCVAFIPFPTSLVAESAASSGVIVLYAVSIALTGLVMSANWWYASSGHRLVSADLTESEIRAFTVRSLSVPLVFLLSIVAALLNAPTLAHILWGSTAFVALFPTVNSVFQDRSPQPSAPPKSKGA